MCVCRACSCINAEGGPRYTYPQLRRLSRQKPEHILAQGLRKERHFIETNRANQQHKQLQLNMYLNAPFGTLNSSTLNRHCVRRTLTPFRCSSNNKAGTAVLTLASINCVYTGIVFFPGVVIVYYDANLYFCLWANISCSR